MSGTIPDAKAAVLRARTAVRDTLTLSERETWKRELDLLEQVLESLTHRLYLRAQRERLGQMEAF